MATSFERALVYWSALGLSFSEIGSRMGCSTEHIERCVHGLLSEAPEGIGTLEGLVNNLNPEARPQSRVSWSNRTAVRLISEGLARTEETPFVFDAGGDALSAADVVFLVAKIRAGFRAAGIGRGARIAVDATQRAESYILALATLLHGGVFVRLGDATTLEALGGPVGSAAASMLFSARTEAFEDGARTRSCIDLSIDGRKDVPSFEAWLDACPAPGADDFAPVEVSPRDAALVGFTSGSTGEPKLVVTPHEAVYRSSEVAVTRFSLDRSDLFYTATDMTALSAFRSLVTLPLLSGGRVLIPSAEARSAPLAAALEVETYGVTRFTVVPNVLRGILKAGNKLPDVRFAALATVFSGSGVLDRATSDGFRERYGVPVIDYYGAREIGTALYSEAGTAGTIGDGGGRAAEVLVDIRDGEGAPLGVGVVGEVHVLTDCGMIASPDGPVVEGRHREEAGGWFATGDLGRRTKEGRIEIVGRGRDIIKAADGSLVFPLEIESLLAGSPEVQEASVFSYLDAAHIERIAAAVVAAGVATGVGTAALETELRALVAQAAGPHRTPQHVLILADFPRVGRNKPDKAALKRLFLETFPL